MEYYFKLEDSISGYLKPKYGNNFTYVDKISFNRQGNDSGIGFNLNIVNTGVSYTTEKLIEIASTALNIKQGDISSLPNVLGKVAISNRENYSSRDIFQYFF